MDVRQQWENVTTLVRAIEWMKLRIGEMYRESGWMGVVFVSGCYLALCWLVNDLRPFLSAWHCVVLLCVSSAVTIAILSSFSSGESRVFRTHCFCQAALLACCLIGFFLASRFPVEVNHGDIFCSQEESAARCATNALPRCDTLFIKSAHFDPISSIGFNVTQTPSSETELFASYSNTVNCQTYVTLRCRRGFFSMDFELHFRLRGRTGTDSSRLAAAIEKLSTTLSSISHWIVSKL